MLHVWGTKHAAAHLPEVVLAALLGKEVVPTPVVTHLLTPLDGICDGALGGLVGGGVATGSGAVRPVVGEGIDHIGGMPCEEGAVGSHGGGNYRGAR